MITEEEKIWVNYMVEQCYLNAILHIQQSPLIKHKITDLETFINEKDDRKSNGLIGWSYRIKLKKLLGDKIF